MSYRALIDCPAGCGKTVKIYTLVHHCPECGWHVNLQKKKSTDADREQRSAWKRFSFETEKYVAFQHKAMLKHLRATDALDRVYIGAHDAFGNPEGAWVMFGK